MQKLETLTTRGRVLVAKPVAHGSGSEIFAGRDEPVRIVEVKSGAPASLVRPIQKLCLLGESGRTFIVLFETLRHENF